MAEFCKAYDLRFVDPAQLKLALTHRSYLHVTGTRDSNERLEFLGDSVLGLVTSANLYLAHPTEHEGQLTKTKSLLVSKAILSRRALAMGLGRFVLMSHSEVESGGRQRLSILADAFEAVIGAIYLDQGFDTARGFIERWLLRDTREIVADKRHTNYKSHLQEFVQTTYRTHPVYRIRHEMGPDHSKQFMVEVIVGRRTLGEGKGRNKKEAEQAAARDALEQVERGPESDRSLKAEARRDRPERGERAEPRERPGREDHPERGARGERGERAERAERAPAETREFHEDDGVDTETGTLSGPGSEERDALSRPRRRGRRGGRGRHRPEGAETGPLERESEGREAAAPEVEAVPQAPRRRREPRPESPRSESPREEVRAEMRPTELEPLPPAYEEDENEEVGRPEGPRNLRDTGLPVIAHEAAVAAPEAEEDPWSPEAAESSRYETDPSPEPTEPEDADESPGQTPEPSPGAPAPPATPTWGRKPGRVRR